MRKLIFMMFITFCVSGLFAQTEYEAVIFDRSVLMGDSVRNVRRDVPYLSPREYYGNVVEGMQQLVYIEERSLSRIESARTEITAEFYLNRLYSVHIYSSGTNNQRIQNDIRALRSIYGNETSNENRNNRHQLRWEFKTPGSDRTIFTVLFSYSQSHDEGIGYSGTHSYSLIYSYSPVANELNTARGR